MMRTQFEQLHEVLSKIAKNTRKPIFTASSIPKQLIDRVWCHNRPVNLSHCTSISIHDFKDPLYVIGFMGCDTKWSYLTKEERDADLQRILALTE